MKYTRSPMLKMDNTVNSTPTAIAASPVKSTASGVPGAMPYCVTSWPVNMETNATGPKPRCILVPKRTYAAPGKIDVYKPLIGGTFANWA